TQRNVILSRCRRRERISINLNAVVAEGHPLKIVLLQLNVAALRVKGDSDSLETESVCDAQRWLTAAGCDLRPQLLQRRRVDLSCAASSGSKVRRSRVPSDAPL